MSTKPFDYSKWDNIDLSDDEEAMHPNIDKSLMIRIRREQREKRKHEEAELRKKLEAENTPEARQKLEQLEKSKKWSVDDICHVVQERTIINRRPDEEAKKKEKEMEEEKTLTEEQKSERKMKKVFEKDDVLPEFCRLRDLQDSQEWLIQHSEVLSEDCASWMLLYMLGLEMEGKTGDMVHATRQYLMFRNILDLASASSKPPGDVIKPFFLQIGQKDKLKELEVETKAFAVKIKQRAVEKRKEELQAAAAAAANGEQLPEGYEVVEEGELPQEGVEASSSSAAAPVREVLD